MDGRGGACSLPAGVAPPPEVAGGLPQTKPLLSGFLVVLVAGLLLTPGIFLRPLSRYDEGLAAYGAVRVQAGAVPYRDFWTLYPPGQFYVLAWFFGLFGPSLLVERVYSVTTDVLTALASHRLATRLVPPRWAMASPVLTVVSLSTLNFGYPVGPALLLTLGSCVFLARFFEGKGSGNLLLAGLLTGGIFLFRHDLGCYATLVGTAVVLCLRPANGLGTCCLSTPAAAARYLAAIAVVVLPVLALLLSSVPWPTLWADLVFFPTTVYPSVRRLPFPGPLPPRTLLFEGRHPPARYFMTLLQRLSIYFPLVVFALTAAGLLARRLRQGRLIGPDRLRFLLLLLGLAYFNHARLRSDQIHLVAATLPAIILFNSLAYEWLSDRGRAWAVRLAAGGLCLALLVAVCAPFRITGASLLRWRKADPAPVPLTLARARGLYAAPSVVGPLEEAVRYVQTHVPAGEKIYVGVSRHDQIFANDVLFYFLSERDSATPYHELHPGQADTAAVQAGIIDDLKRHRVAYLVLDETTDDEEPSDSHRVGAGDLDRYITRHYTPARQFGPFTILRRKTHSGSDA